MNPAPGADSGGLRGRRQGLPRGFPGYRACCRRSLQAFRGLWPLYRILTAVDFLDSGLIVQIREATAALDLVAPLLRDDDAADTEVDADGTAALGYELARSDIQFILANVGSVSRAATAIRKAALALNGVGTVLLMIGQKGVFDELEIQIHGYVGSRIKNDWTTKAGLFCNGVAVGLSQVASAVKAQMRHAMLIGSLAEVRSLSALGDNGATIVANQEAILANQATLLEGIGDLPWRRGEGKGCSK